MWWDKSTVPYATMIKSASWKSNLLGFRPPATDENLDSPKIMMALSDSMANEYFQDTFRPNIGYCMSKFSLPDLELGGFVQELGKRMAPIRSVPQPSKSIQKPLSDPIPEWKPFLGCYCSCTKSRNSWNGNIEIFIECFIQPVIAVWPQVIPLFFTTPKGLAGSWGPIMPGLQRCHQRIYLCHRHVLKRMLMLMVMVFVMIMMMMSVMSHMYASIHPCVLVSTSAMFSTMFFCCHSSYSGRVSMSLPRTTLSSASILESLQRWKSLRKKTRPVSDVSRNSRYHTASVESWVRKWLYAKVHLLRARLWCNYCDVSFSMLACNIPELRLSKYERTWHISHCKAKMFQLLGYHRRKDQLF